MRSEDESRSLTAQHFKWVHAFDANANARVWDLDLLGGRCCHLMSHHDMTVGQGVRYKIKIRHLQKCVHRGWFIVLPGGPTAHPGQRRQYGCVGFEEESIAPG